MNEYWAIAQSVEKPRSRRQYVTKIEAENEEDAWEKAEEWFIKNHRGHCTFKYEYFLTKKISK